MQKQYHLLVAKAGQETEGKWLPLWMHLKDTEGVMKHLVSKWVSPSVILAANLNDKLFCATAVFLAAIHDIGKATSYFQSIITRSCDGKYEEITSSGFVVNKVYRAEGKTPHAHAGQWILQSDMIGLGLHESLAMVVDAHHGKPLGSDSIMGESDLVQMYPINFYGKENEDKIKTLWKNAWKDILDQAKELAGLHDISELLILTLVFTETE